MKNLTKKELRHFAIGGFVLAVILITISLIALTSAIFEPQISGDIQIEYSKIDVIKQNTIQSFRFHLFNSTSLIGGNAQCNFLLYNPDGKLIYQNNTISFIVASGNEFEINLTGSNFSRIGEHSYITECNTTTQAGMVSVPIKVTPSGNDFGIQQSILYIPFYLVLFFLFGISLYFALQLPSSNMKDEEGRIMSITWIKYLRPPLFFICWVIVIGILFITSNLGLAFLGEEMFSKIFFSLFRIMLGLTIVILFVWFAWTLVSFFQDKRFQNMINRGIFPTGRDF